VAEKRKKVNRAVDTTEKDITGIGIKSPNPRKEMGKRSEVIKSNCNMKLQKNYN
jgi:hypothetical protein